VSDHPFYVDDVPGGPEVEELFAWVGVDSFGGEGLIAMRRPGSALWLPLVAQDLYVARDVMGPVVRDELAPKVRGRRYELRRFVEAELVERFDAPTELDT
jgi:hypothetical protein